MMMALQQTLTLAWRSLVLVRRNPWELGDYSIQPVLFLVLFLFVFGGAVAGSPDDYLGFVLPGVIVMNMLFVTVYVGHGLNTDLTQGVFDRFRALPIPRWAPLVGRIVADAVKQLLCITLLLAVGTLLGFRLGTSVLHLLAMVLLVIGFALSFSWVLVLVGVLAKDPEHVQLYGFTTLFPLTFVSTAFVPIETMPGWLQGFVAANPVSLLTEAARALLSGGHAATPALLAIAWAVGIALVFAPLSVWMLNRRLARG